MKDAIEAYLASKPTQWLESELEQAHACASDETKLADTRESALTAAVMLAKEIEKRKQTAQQP